MIQHSLGTQRLDRAQHLGLFVVHRLGIEGNRRLHRGKRDELKDVVGHHVAKRAGCLVIPAAQLDAKFLGHRHLHVVHVAAIPHRLENAVRKTKGQNILNGFFPKIVVDAVDLFLFQC